MSLDGYFEGPGRELDWHSVDEELHQHFNDVLAPMGTVTFREVLFVAGPRMPEMPLNSTSVAPKRFIPVSVTFVFARPVPGENPVRVGAT